MKLFEQYKIFLEERIDKKIVLFGAGRLALRYIDKELKYNDIYCFSDNEQKKWNTEFVWKQVIPPYELIKHNDEILIIVTNQAYLEVYEQLRAMGITAPILSHEIFHFNSHIVSSYLQTKETIKQVNDNIGKINVTRSLISDIESLDVYNKCLEKRKYLLADFTDVFEPLQPQYFANYFSYAEDEIFVDAGAYDGDTAIAFAKIVNYKYKKIYSFEPNADLYKKIMDRCKDMPNIEIFPCGLSDQNATLDFCMSGAGSGFFKGASTKADVRTLDSVVREPVTFIKMDIEGQELAALHGAENIIKRCKPKLAICLYHKLSDFWEIPLYIKELVPEYKLYVRHHYTKAIETVLYATL